MQTCEACQQELNGDEVQLKDGTFLCPSCFQQKFAPKPKVDVPWYSSLSTESIAAGVFVVAFLFAGYITYRHYKAEAVEKAAQEAEEAARNAARELELAESRKKQEAVNAALKAEAAKREAERAVAIEAANKLAAERKEADARKREADAAARTVAQKEKEERIAKLKAEAAERARTERSDSTQASVAPAVEPLSTAEIEEIATLRGQALSLIKQVKRVEADRPAKLKAMTTFNTIFEAKKSALEGMYAKYKSVLRSESWGTNKTPVWEREWQPSYFTRSTNVGNTTVTQESEYIPVAAQYNKIAEECRARLADVAKLKAEIGSMDAEIADGQSKVLEIVRRLRELRVADVPSFDASPAQKLELAPVPGTVRLAGFKTLYKKNGTTIQIQSFMTIDKEMKYKDEKGVWHVLPTSEVDRVENNSDGSRPEMVPGSGTGKGKVDI